LLGRNGDLSELKKKVEGGKGKGKGEGKRRRDEPRRETSFSPPSAAAGWGECNRVVISS